LQLGLPERPERRVLSHDLDDPAWTGWLGALQSRDGPWSDCSRSRRQLLWSSGARSGETAQLGSLVCKGITVHIVGSRDVQPQAVTHAGSGGHDRERGGNLGREEVDVQTG
jgi:hypothetical protein